MIYYLYFLLFYFFSLLFRLESKITALNYPGYNDVYTGRKSKKRHVQSENDYHYTAFIPFKDDVWELDGYNKTPVNYGNNNC